MLKIERTIRAGLKSRIKIILTGSLILIWLINPFPVIADIYSYIDGAGIIHFTNVPTSSTIEYKVYLKEAPSKRSPNVSNNRFDHLIQQASDTNGIPFYLLKAIIKAESDFNPQAVSKAGAMGLMQIMPENIADLRVKDPFDPQENIMAGSIFFKTLYTRFNGQLPLALAAYNAGPGMVDRYQSIPPFRETEDYVQKVMRYYYAFRQ
jgi:soluble lytic murein transglycosylase